MKSFESPAGSVGWNPELRCVEMALAGFVDGAELREILEKGLELVQEKGARRWVGDMRDASVITDEDLQWVRERWMPRAREAGLRTYVVVMSTKRVARMQMERLKKNADADASPVRAGVETHLFTEVESAYDWLRRRP